MAVFTAWYPKDISDCEKTATHRQVPDKFSSPWQQCPRKTRNKGGRKTKRQKKPALFSQKTPARGGQSQPPPLNPFFHFSCSFRKRVHTNKVHTRETMNLGRGLACWDSGCCSDTALLFREFAHLAAPLRFEGRLHRCLCRRQIPGARQSS